MNGNTIIGGNKTPQIGDEIRETARESGRLEYVKATTEEVDWTDWKEDGQARGWEGGGGNSGIAKCAPAGYTGIYEAFD